MASAVPIWPAGQGCWQLPGCPVVPVLHTQAGGVPVESDGQVAAPDPTQAKLEKDVFTGFWFGLLQRH